VQHPDVFMSDPKEPHFLDFEGETLDFRGPGDDLMINRVAITDLARYERLFDKAGSAKAIGEASIEYGYYAEKSIRGMRRHVPNARLICMLRNPADRAFSAYGFMRARMFEPLASFEEALEQEEARIAANWHHIWHYRRMGFYYPQLAPFFAAFPREQIRVYLFEEFRRDPMSVVRDVFRFLDVDPDAEIPDTPQTVVSGAPKNVLLQRVLMSAWRMKGVLAPLLPTGLRRRLWGRLNAANVRKEHMAPETRARLLDGYREDILRTQELLGRDLGLWLAPRGASSAKA
jgi:hypothetical protein